jgi:hypothetical protein
VLVMVGLLIWCASAYAACGAGSVIGVFPSPGVYAWDPRQPNANFRARFSGLLAASASAQFRRLKPTGSPVNGAENRRFVCIATPGVNAWAKEKQPVVAGAIHSRSRWPVSALLLGLLALAGCQQKMAKEPKYLPLQESSFFGDGRSERPDVPGAVARGSLEIASPDFQGLRSPPAEGAPPPTSFGTVGIDSTPDELRRAYSDKFPFAITREVLERGQQRFTIYCAVCHGSLGDGNGTIVERGFTSPPTYHSDRLRQAPVGYLFNVATHGFGAMPSLDGQIPPRDRWTIIAYIRALQLSQHAALKDLPSKEQEQATAGLSQTGNSQTSNSRQTGAQATDGGAAK